MSESSLFLQNRLTVHFVPVYSIKVVRDLRTDETLFAVKIIITKDNKNIKKYRKENTDNKISLYVLSPVFSVSINHFYGWNKRHERSKFLVQSVSNSSHWVWYLLLLSNSVCTTMKRGVCIFSILLKDRL